jgi:hypothetical protein
LKKSINWNNIHFGDTHTITERSLSVKKRDRKLILAKETIRDLVPGENLMAVHGGSPSCPAPPSSTAGTIPYCCLEATA